MRDLQKEFKDRTIEFDKLVSYGFKKKDQNYVLKKNIDDDNFQVIIEISVGNQIAKVIDLVSQEEYMLVDVVGSVGEFVGGIREAYENVIKDVLKNCTTPHVFKSKQANEIIQYIKGKYQDELEYLWDKFPNNAIWRDKESKKWYGLLIVLPECKLGVESEQICDIIVLRYPKDKLDQIVDGKTIFPGYHMNKKNWITVKLDGSMRIQDICSLVDQSYQLSKMK